MPHTAAESVFPTEAKGRPVPMIVVSNRLPFVLRRMPDGSLVRKSSAGGLVTAVAPVVIDCKGLWVGWTGMDDFDPEVDVIPESDPQDQTPTAGLRSEQAIPVCVEPKLFDTFYNGCCNATYWPLFHSMPDRAVFSRAYWDAYTKVNELFALATVKALKQMKEKLKEQGDDRPPIVWVHDYHLMVAANTIRDICYEEDIEIRMGFFLHIPFPSFDIIRIFPWMDEILQGMLGCDLVGFHIEDYCLNFLDCCQRVLGCRHNKKKMLLEYQKRSVQVKPLPIGIPYAMFENLANISSSIIMEKGLKVILGVDRLDYTKGLVARLKGLEDFLSACPYWIEKITFIQIAVPSRTDVKEYQELKESIDRMVGHINGRFTTVNWSPIRYIFGSVSQQVLASYYRRADVALVTPLRDGMNLVAKEFVACQQDEDPGVLVLSPFAGAGGLMQEALMANPYEPNSIAEVLDRALRMPLEERQLRMNQLKKREKRMDVDVWVKNFLHCMDSIHQVHHPGLILDHNLQNPLSSGTSYINDVFEAFIGHGLEDCPKLGVILDFDGTLSPLAPTPALAFLPHETKKVLERLANMPEVNIVIISGREIEDLKQKVSIEGLIYAGSQGLKIIHPDGQRYIHHIEKGYQERLRELEKDLIQTVQRNGAWVEQKDLLVAWHFREVDRELKTNLMSKAKEIYSKHGFETLMVSKRLENIPSGRDRGDACIHILRTIYGLDWEERVRVIYAGDSAADELAISRLKGVAVTCRVMNEDSPVITKTDADFRLDGYDAVLALLKYLERKLAGKTPRNLSRTSSVLSVGGADSNVIEFMPDTTEEMRSRTNSQGSKSNPRAFRVRTSSQGSLGGVMQSQGSLRRKTLNQSLHNRISIDETHRAEQEFIPSPVTP